MNSTSPKVDSNVKKAPKKPKISYVRMNQLIRAGTIAAFVAIGLAVASLAGNYLYDVQVTQVRQGQLEILTKEKANISAQQIAESITDLRSKITYFTDQAAIQYAINPDATEIFTDTAIQLKNNIPNIKHVRYIPINTAKLEPNSIPPIRYSELEMINRAEKGQMVAPDAAKINDVWQITLVTAALTSGENIITPGVFVITLDIDNISQQLHSLVGNFGTMTFSQGVGNNAKLSILQVGQAHSETAEHISKVSYAADIANSSWQIELKPSAQLYALTSVNMGITYILLTVICLVSILTSVVLGFLTSSLIIKKRPAPRSKINKVSQTHTTPPTTKSEPESFINTIYQGTNILDVEIREEDKALLPLDDLDENDHDDDDVFDIAEAHTEEADQSIPEDIFRAYDIRGLADTQISESVALRIGQALGSEALDHREESLVVAQDARIHSPKLTKALIEGILSTGCNVIDIGIVPTPLMYFACEVLPETHSGVIVTASHNRKEYNGFKVVMAGNSRSDKDIQAIRSRILKEDLYEGAGQQKSVDVVPQYINTIFSDVALAGDIHIVIDAGNGVTGAIAPQLFEELGCKVTPLYCNLDGNFPNHDPDPTIEENLHDLIAKVKTTKADLGVAFDGDGDRLMVVTASGKIIWPDILLMLFAKDILSRNPGSDVIFDVKSTRHLSSLVTTYGGRPIMWKTGHSPMKEKMKETGALLGGEYSGHLFIKDRWYGFDDGMYAAARLIEILSLQGDSLDQLFEEFPKSLSTAEIRINVDDKKKFIIVERLKSEANFDDGNINLLDGIRVDFANGWGLIRASNTGPQITLRFEADDAKNLKHIKDLFARELHKIDHTLSTNWNTH